jgi:hypothetical protein
MARIERRSQAPVMIAEAIDDEHADGAGRLGRERWRQYQCSGNQDPVAYTHAGL